jgi:hypothetical protein
LARLHAFIAPPYDFIVLPTSAHGSGYRSEVREHVILNPTVNLLDGGKVRIRPDGTRRPHRLAFV